MLAQQTIALLHHLKLPAMADALEEQRRSPDIGSLDFEDRLSLLLEREHLASAASTNPNCCALRPATGSSNTVCCSLPAQPARARAG